jgi:hypothetical protein
MLLLAMGSMRANIAFDEKVFELVLPSPFA